MWRFVFWALSIEFLVWYLGFLGLGFRILGFRV